MGHELGDLDGDDDLDVVVGGRTERAIGVFTNDGTGGLGPRSLFPTDQSVEVARLGDLDGDGDLDAVVGGSLVDDDNGLSVLLGEGDGTSARPRKTRCSGPDDGPRGPER